jgi:hypothetical protein
LCEQVPLTTLVFEVEELRAANFCREGGRNAQVFQNIQRKPAPETCR